MASQARRGGVSLPDRRNPKNEESSIIAKLSQSPIVSRGKQAVSDAGFVTKKLLKSTGKAAWIAGTTFLILFVPLIIEMDREQQMNDLELQQASLLGSAPQKWTRVGSHHSGINAQSYYYHSVLLGLDFDSGSVIQEFVRFWSYIRIREYLRFTIILPDAILRFFFGC